MRIFPSAFSLQPSAFANWLPDMDLNHDKQIQSLLCYRYTIGQAGASNRLKGFAGQSRLLKPSNRSLVEPAGTGSDADTTIPRFHGSTVPFN